MKTKLLLLLLSRRDNSGFAIALALMIGLVMVLVGLSLMVRSTKQQTHAQASQVTVEGVSLAEVGVTRFQDLLNQNRYVALYDDCVSRNATTNVCEDSGTTISWSNIASIPNIVACQAATDIEVDDVAYDIDEWVTIPNKGQYRLLSYRYQKKDSSQPDNTAPGTGILTLEGRVKENNDLQVATSRLVVEIPVKESEPETVGIPGLWTTVGGLGGNSVKGDVLLNDCNVSNLDTLNNNNIVDDTVNGIDYSAKHTAMEFPDLPPQPTGTAPYLGDLDETDFDAVYLDATSKKVFEFPRKDSSGNISDTPRSIDTTDADGNPITIQVYEYIIDTIDLPSSSHKVLIEPGKRVTFYLNGDIIKGADFVHSCDDGAGGTIADCKPTNFQIYGYGTTTPTDGTQHKICVNGSDIVEVFVFAPDYKVGAAGAGGGGGFKGSVWANTWTTNSNCGSNTSNIVVEQTARWEDLVGLTPKNMPPKLSSISDWQRLERD